MTLLIRLLLSPADAVGLDELAWDLLIRQARRANLLAELGWRLQDCGLLDRVPVRPRWHVDSAMRVVAQQEVAMRHEVTLVVMALSQCSVRVIFLKGAGYLLSASPIARGRTFSDVDILVPKTHLDAVESALRQHGWQGLNHDAYDQNYYRRWMHELPPMTHVRRGTSLDVHHTILPESARLKVDTPTLLQAIVPVSGEPGVHVLAPIDMLLHSATHLFHEGEFDNALRDLFDLDGMLRHFPTLPGASGFWSQLVPRASRLGLARPLYYALRYTHLMLATPVPAAVLEAARIGRPPAAVAWLMDRCYLRALQPIHRSTDSPAAAAARIALYLRSHWIRMPLHLLAYHLGRKLVVRMFSKPVEESAAAPLGGA